MTQWTTLAKQTEGSALLEFAIVLPLLVVFVVGIYDFSGAFNQKQKVAQAAQQGAITAGAQPTSDIDPSNGDPDSLHSVVTIIFNSLAGSGVLSLASSCKPVTIAPSGHPAGLTWTYTISGCPDNLIITINRGWMPPGATATPPVTVGTQVTVDYPYHWRFNSAIQLLVPSASYTNTPHIIETAAVHNQF
jgi:Flp pilus assembly protein TadG